MPRPTKKPTPRTAAEVAHRALILLAVINSGHNNRRAKLVPWLKREGLWKFVSPQESRFLRNSKPPHKAIINATWRVEALIPLLWALRLYTKFPAPKMFRGKLRRVMPEILTPTADFIAAARLRPESQLRRAQDLTYRTNWALRDAEIKGKKPPKSVVPGVIWERHHALNWLVNDDNESWDNVSTDT